jgi:hypothetical protein
MAARNLKRARRIRKAVLVISVVSGVLGIFVFSTGIASLEELKRVVRSRWDAARAAEPRPAPAARQETLDKIDAKLEMAVAGYNSTVAAVRTGGAPVEQAFSKVKELEWALMYDTAEDGRSVLARMSEVDRAQLTLRVPGVRIWYHESQGVVVDPAFFLELATRHGDKADRVFFVNYRKTFPGGYQWPVYVEQQTDVTGCTRYGRGDLVAVYGMWSSFVNAYPANYVDEARSYLEAVSHELTSGTCACGDARTVIKELSQFVASFPNDKITPQVERRLNSVVEGKSTIRFNCLSG